MLDAKDRSSRKVAGQEMIEITVFHNEETRVDEYRVVSSGRRTKREPFPDQHNERVFYAQVDESGHIAAMWDDTPRRKMNFDARPHLIKVYHHRRSAQRRLAREAEKYERDLGEFLGIK